MSPLALVVHELEDDTRTVTRVALGGCGQNRGDGLAPLDFPGGIGGVRGTVGEPAHPRAQKVSQGMQPMGSLCQAQQSVQAVIQPHDDARVGMS